MLYGAGRRGPAASNPRLQLHAVDFAALPALPPVDDVYIALGTTIAAAGSQQVFRAVDHGAVLATAQAARAAGATRCGVVSAMGADPASRIFYNRVKGEVERDLRNLGFEVLVIARPALLMGDRQALQQAHRPAESLSMGLFRWLNPLVPHNYRARPASDVGQALVRAVQTAPPGVHVLCGRALGPQR
ncbi:nucleoside-diphosphate sugar epimerase [Acidovorax sp.]|uniref:nucleoside-diphosphate sugar epimerase n=1 Tax=Acidovorax sp. TaxID=1872122 RepID=UPI003919ED9D